MSIEFDWANKSFVFFSTFYVLIFVENIITVKSFHLVVVRNTMLLVVVISPKSLEFNDRRMNRLQLIYCTCTLIAIIYVNAVNFKHV